MSPEKISQMLDELNDSHFRGVLGYEYSEHPKEDTSVWGPYIWMLRYDGPKYGWFQPGQVLRPTWLNTRRSWEIRHSGGGGNFVWWIDSVVTNEVAVRFDGTISDEGVGNKWKGEPGKYKNFQEFQEMMTRHVKDETTKRWLYQQEQELFVPEAFHIDLGEKIEVKVG